MNNYISYIAKMYKYFVKYYDTSALIVSFIFDKNML